MMLNLYVESQLMRRDLESWLAKQRKRMLLGITSPCCSNCSR